MKSRQIGDNTLKLGEELDGRGKRIYFNGEDVTHRALDYLGPRHENRGLPVPHGDDYVLNTLEMAIRSGEIETV